MSLETDAQETARVSVQPFDSYNPIVNFILKVITFLPNFTKYLKGVTSFHERRYEAAIEFLEKSLNHPSLNNELAFSYYGQSLCAVGRFEEAYPYLAKASQIYESESWTFKDSQGLILAKNTLTALKHINEETDIKIDRSLLEAEPQIKGS